MIKKTITFEGIDGPTTEDFYFNLNKTELAEWMLQFPGDDLGGYLKLIGETSDPRVILPMFREIVGRAIGYRDSEGRFVKDPSFTAAFLSGDAYSELFMSFIQDGSTAAQFITGMLPANMAAELQKANEPKQHSTEELLNMDDAEFYATVGENPRHWSKDVTAVAMQRKTRQAA